MEEIVLAEKSIELIRKDFDLPDGELITEDPWGQLFDQLKPIIKGMLDSDFSQLLNTLYRIDVPENQVKGILETADPAKLSEEITNAIIARQKQKVILRAKYSSENQ
ncbi:MAG: hypothetical protein ABJ004_09330 [Cyclobacteriaceae bacterium]